MTLPQLKKFLKAAKKQDLFWVALGDNVLDEPQPFDHIKALVLKYPDWEISILHQDHAEQDNPHWSLLTDIEIEGERNPLRPDGPIKQLTNEVATLKADLKASSRIVEILQEFVEFNDTYEARKAEFEEREKYLQNSEDQLMQKAHELEELRAELEHKAEGKAKNVARSA
ncbi:MAG: hypothetical protein ACQKBV_08715 [Puniceicoccales bacterium]